MIDERRKKLAALSFGEKLELLEKLRQRSLMLAEAREKFATERGRWGLTGQNDALTKSSS